MAVLVSVVMKEALGASVDDTLGDDAAWTACGLDVIGEIADDEPPTPGTPAWPSTSTDLTTRVWPHVS